MPGRANGSPKPGEGPEFPTAPGWPHHHDSRSSLRSQRNLISHATDRRTLPDELIESNRADEATAVELEIGPLSGVEVDLIESAFEQLAPETRCRQAILSVVRSPLRVRCNDCSSVTDLTNFVFKCGACDSGNVTVVCGDELRLLSVTVQETDND